MRYFKLNFVTPICSTNVSYPHAMGIRSWGIQCGLPCCVWLDCVWNRVATNRHMRSSTCSTSSSISSSSQCHAAAAVGAVGCDHMLLTRLYSVRGTRCARVLVWLRFHTVWWKWYALFPGIHVMCVVNGICQCCARWRHRTTGVLRRNRDVPLTHQSVVS